MFSVLDCILIATISAVRLSFQEVKAANSNLYEFHGRMAPTLAYSSCALPPSDYLYFVQTYFSYTSIETQVHRGFDSSKLKTQLCRQFEEQGTCGFGLQCSFAHGMGQLRRHNPLFRTKPCKRYVQSSHCWYGNNCHFIHTDYAKDSLNGSEGSSYSTTSENTAESKSSEETAEGESSAGEIVESDSSGETVESDSPGETGESDSSGEDSEYSLLEIILRIHDWESEWPALNELFNNAYGKSIETEAKALPGINCMNLLFV